MAKPTKIEKKLLHCTGKAITDFNMIQAGDKIMVCLSGGKDSYTLLHLLSLLRKRTNNMFDIFAFTLDQQQPGWDDASLRHWLRHRDIPFDIHSQDTYSIVTDKLPETKTYCSLCSRLRRGIIYNYAEKHGFSKIALGHHRDDLIESLLMSIFYNGEVRSMPPKLLTDDKRNIVIRPLAYCREQDIIDYTREQQFPVIPCNLCGSQDNLKRQRIKKLIREMSAENDKIPSNVLHALTSIKPSQLMDESLWDFRTLEQKRQTSQNIENCKTDLFNDEKATAHETQKAEATAHPIKFIGGIT